MRRIRQGFSHLWLVGALAWGGLSLVVLLEYRKLGGQPRELNELWFLMSLLWGQFCFAAIFADWRQNRGRNFGRLLLRTVLPPLILHLLVFGVL